MLNLRQHSRERIRWLEIALIADRRLQHRHGEANALGNLGIAYSLLGETRRAIEFFEQQLAIGREIADRRGEGNALWSLSVALDQLGERAQAMNHAEEAFSIYEQIEDPNAAQVRTQLAAWREQTKA